MRIKMTSVHVTDPEKAHDFYTAVLGFETLMAMPEHSLFIVRAKDDPTGPGLLLEPSDNPVARAYMEGVHRLGLPTIVFGVADVWAEYRRLGELGVEFRGEPTEDPSGLSVVLEDTVGNLVQLHQD